jgi:hypothetical protein
MLKIKDDVDLKELEKFGLEETERTYLKRFTLGEATSIHKDTGAIYLTEKMGETYYFNTDLLYDLIQAGLVEKI